MKYRLDRAEYTSDEGLLLVDQTVINLPTRLHRLLTLLIESDGHYVSKETLLDRIWSDKVVEYSSLGRAISDLRKLLHSHSIDIDFEPVRGKGYTLAGDVELLEPSSQSSQVTERRYVLIGLAIITAVIAWVVMTTHDEQDASLNETALALDPPETPDGLPSLPRISPDGTRLAYVHGNRQGLDQSIHIAAMNGDSDPEIIKLPSIQPDSAKGMPIWLADGSGLVFPEFNREARMCRVSVYRFDGGELGELGDCVGLITTTDKNITSVAITSDPPMLLSNHPNDIQRIYATELNQHETQEPVRLTEGPMDITPRVSASGRVLAYIKRQALGQSDLFTYQFDDRQHLQRTELQMYINGFSWHGDDTLYAIRADGPSCNNTELIRLSLGDNRIESAALEGCYYNPSIDHDNGEFIYLQKHERIQYISAQSLTGPSEGQDYILPERVIASRYEEAFPRVHPALERMHFLSNRDGRFGVWSTELDGSDARNEMSINAIANIDVDCDIGSVAYHPNRAAYACHTGTEADGYLIVASFDENGNSIQAFPAPPHTLDDWLDDQTLLVHDDTHSYTFDITNGMIMQIDRELISARQQHEGMEYFIRQDQPGLWVRQPGESLASARRLIDEFSPVDATLWQLVDGSIYYVMRTQIRDEIWRYDVAEETSEKLASLAPDTIARLGFTVDPYSNRAYFVEQRNNETSIVRIDNPFD